jgi:hypothetical protein
MSKQPALETIESSVLTCPDPTMMVEMLLVEAEALRIQAEVNLRLGPDPTPTLPLRDMSPLGR